MARVRRRSGRSGDPIRRLDLWRAWGWTSTRRTPAKDVRAEEHVTRGRAHLLWEMMRGEVITEGWKSEDVKEALDLCLACKGCKGECPVHVDVATYKAEFLSHYYESKSRPRAAYAMGMISSA